MASGTVASPVLPKERHSASADAAVQPRINPSRGARAGLHRLLAVDDGALRLQATMEGTNLQAQLIRDILHRLQPDMQELLQADAEV